MVDNEDYKEVKNEFDDFSNQNFKKLSFIDFFINNIYSKCCKKFNKQEFINTCNSILLKYCSIESILYNQLLLDNLFKDYRWNNIELNNLSNNEFFIKLKNLL